MMLATVEQYSQQANLPYVASEYTALERAYREIGNDRALFVSEGRVSQYPIFEAKLSRTALVAADSADSLWSEMNKRHVRYAIFGNVKYLAGEEERSRWQDYSEIAKDFRFEEVIRTGSARLLALRGAAPGPSPDVYGENLELRSSDVRFDSASLRGECKASECEVLVFNNMPVNSECTNSQGNCSIVYDGDAGAMRIRGILHGTFEISAKPRHFDYEPWLVLACALVLAACLVLSRR